MRRTAIKPTLQQRTTGNYYSIHFNSELSWEFTNKRKAERFALTLNLFISEKLQSANDLLIELYSIYRRLFFVIQKYDGLQIQQKFRAVEDAIERSLTNSGIGENGAYWCFNKLRLSLTELKEIGEMLYVISDKRKVTSDLHSIRAKLRVIALLTEDTNNYENRVLIDLNRKPLQVDLGLTG